MLRFLTNLPISRRLLLAAALSALIPGIVLATLGNSYITTLITINNTVQSSNNAVKLVTDMQADLLRMNALLATLSATSTSTVANVETSTEIVQDANDFHSSLTTYQQNYQITTSNTMESIRQTLQNSGLGNQTPISQHSMILVVNLQWQVYETAQSQVLSDVQHDRGTAMLANDVAEANLEYLPVKGNLDNLVAMTESISQIVAQVNTLQINPILFWTIFAIIFTTLLVFAISIVINFTITRPLSQLVSLTERIGQGETEARASVAGHDEIQKVAISMNTMLDNIVNLMHNIQGQRDLLQARVEKLIREVEGLGAGDLRTQAAVTDDALGFLARSFNYMIIELSNLVIRVKMVAYEVETLTGATQANMVQLVEVGEHQFQKMNDAVMAVEKMADSSYKVAERVQTLAVIAQETQQTAQSGRSTLERAGKSIERIHETVQITADKFQVLGESSREINNIVTVIANIAHQTNRLSLDASIQAAMAGENGKGFGAVASDIRRLAEQTKNQASMIAALVRTVNENINVVADAVQATERETANGTGLARQTGTALTSIFDVVERETRAIEDINDAATQQLHLARTLLQIMQSVSDATRHSVNSTREATQNMWRLAQLVERLRFSVGAFQLHEELGYRKEK